VKEMPFWVPNQFLGQAYNESKLAFCFNKIVENDFPVGVSSSQ